MIIRSIFVLMKYFTCLEYMLDPKIWGRTLWRSLIYIAKGFPHEPTDQNRRDYMIFYTLLGKVLPCEVCQDNYSNHLRILPPDVSSKDSLLQWLHKLNNRTLKQMNRQEKSYEDFMAKYLVDNPEATMWRYAFMAILVVLIVVIYYCFVYKRGNSRF
jgi:hypothetical protein